MAVELEFDLAGLQNKSRNAWRFQLHQILAAAAVAVQGEDEETLEDINRLLAVINSFLDGEPPDLFGADPSWTDERMIATERSETLQARARAIRHRLIANRASEAAAAVRQLIEEGKELGEAAKRISFEGVIDSLEKAEILLTAVQDVANREGTTARLAALITQLQQTKERLASSS